MELIFGLLESGMPKSAVTDLCHVFLQQAIIPWRSAEAQGSSVAPHFDLEMCQRFLRENKEHNARD
jgi:hypothetical protein